MRASKRDSFDEQNFLQSVTVPVTEYDSYSMEEDEEEGRRHIPYAGDGEDDENEEEDEGEDDDELSTLNFLVLVCKAILVFMFQNFMIFLFSDILKNLKTLGFKDIIFLTFRCWDSS